MAENETTAAGTEQIYTIPLRDTRDAPAWKKTNKAIKVIREYLAKHMKIDEDKIKIKESLNEAIWAHGARKPPAKIRVKVTKSAEGIVEAEVVGSE
jgi:large subunit ribosomal protein L31e